MFRSSELQMTHNDAPAIPGFEFSDNTKKIQKFKFRPLEFYPPPTTESSG